MLLPFSAQNLGKFNMMYMCKLHVMHGRKDFIIPWVLPSVHTLYWSVNSHFPLMSLPATSFHWILQVPAHLFPVSSFCILGTSGTDLHLASSSNCLGLPFSPLSSQLLIARGKKTWKERWEWLTDSYSGFPTAFSFLQTRFWSPRLVFSSRINLQ